MPSYSGRRRTGSVHLHERGADVIERARTPDIPGPPPRARSRSSRTRSCAAISRSTSTSAEPIWPAVDPVKMVSVHLHERGADVSGTVRLSIAVGPPPRARSRCRGRHRRRDQHRSTSTSAEPMVTQRAPGPAAPVHLHERGADSYVDPRETTVDGPPPRARSRYFLTCHSARTLQILYLSGFCGDGFHLDKREPVEVDGVSSSGPGGADREALFCSRGVD